MVWFKPTSIDHSTLNRERERGRHIQRNSQTSNLHGAVPVEYYPKSKKLVVIAFFLYKKVKVYSWFFQSGQYLKRDLWKRTSVRSNFFCISEIVFQSSQTYIKVVNMLWLQGLPAFLPCVIFLIFPVKKSFKNNICHKFP